MFDKECQHAHKSMLPDGTCAQCRREAAQAAILPEVILLLQSDDLTEEEVFQFVSSRLMSALANPASE